jgi:hypothetical protein
VVDIYILYIYICIMQVRYFLVIYCGYVIAIQTKIDDVNVSISNLNEYCKLKLSSGSKGSRKRKGRRYTYMLTYTHTAFVCECVCAYTPHTLLVCVCVGTQKYAHHYAHEYLCAYK